MKFELNVRGITSAVCGLAIVGAWFWLGTTTPVAIVATGSMVPTLHIGWVLLALVVSVVGSVILGSRTFRGRVVS